MKKIFHHFTLLLIINFIFIGCNSDDDLEVEEGEGVVINGIRWATSNVAAPGTFAANPEDAGMLFQWNRQQGWAATGNVIGWDSTMPTGTEWETANDPCPLGWRVPTVQELESLRAVSHRWERFSGVYGRLFGTEPNQIFLPAVGGRDYNGVIYVSVQQGGFYWSNAQGNSPHQLVGGLGLSFSALTAIGIGMARRDFGLPVRCVAK